MAGSSEAKKLAVWRRRFRRFPDSGLSVARFCAAEGVSVSSFYYWQKKVGRGARRQTARTRRRFAGKEGSPRVGDVGDAHIMGGRGAFQPVTVMPAAQGVVVHLPDGTRIEVDPTRLDAIRAVVTETMRGAWGRATAQDSPSAGRAGRPGEGNASC
jgi:hypothetical protein